MTHARGVNDLAAFVGEPLRIVRKLGKVALKRLKFARLVRIGC